MLVPNPSRWYKGVYVSDKLIPREFLRADFGVPASRRGRLVAIRANKNLPSSGDSRETSAGMRVSKREYLMGFAEHAATRSTCPRRAVGAVFVRDGRVLATGYNGSMPGEAHCTDDGCLHVPEDSERCRRTIHAEVNALAHAARNGVALEGASLYVTTKPCWDCYKLCRAAGIHRVFYLEDYPGEDSRLVSRFSQGRVHKCVF